VLKKLTLVKILIFNAGTRHYTNQQRCDLPQTSEIELYSFNECAFTFRVQLCALLSTFLPRVR